MEPIDTMEPILLNLPPAAMKELKIVADAEFRTSEAQATVILLTSLGLLKKDEDSAATIPKARRGR